MYFYEKELRTLFEEQYPDATFVGRCCYIPLGKQTRAKISFQTNGISTQYNTLGIWIINREEGHIDYLGIRLRELLGMKPTLRGSSYNEVEPYIWEYENKPGWYGFTPSQQDYALMRGAAIDYINVFMEPDLQNTEGMTMQM